MSAWRPDSTAKWWALALAYYVAGCLMHLQFSLWLVRQRLTVLGRLAYSDAMPWLVLAGGCGLALWLAIRIPRSAHPRMAAAYWLLWLAAIGLIDRYLTYSINECMHYPQYAGLAWLLARALDPQRSGRAFGRVLFWTTLLGAGDELLQYLWITSSYSDYMDFNDVLTNLVAAAAGTMLYYSAGRREPDAGPTRRPVVEAATAVVLVLVIGTGLLAGRLVPTPVVKVPPGGIVRADDGWRLYMQRGPDFYGGWQPSKRHVRYHVMAPVPGLLVVLAAGLLFAGVGAGAAGRTAFSRATSRSPSSAWVPPA